jgi:hypothetical protein
MKIKIILLLIPIVILTILFISGCKPADKSELEERMAELEEELAENKDREAIEEPQKEAEEVIKEPKEEEPEEIKLEYYPECEISFEYENFFEISQKGLDLGYPYFSFTFADEWEVEEIPEDSFGYLVRFRSPDYININTETVSDWDMPIMDERIYILNDEHQDITPSQFIEELWRPTFGLPELDIMEFTNIDEKIFLIIWQEPGGNTFWEHFRFSDIGGKVFLHIVSAIDYCYDPWSDVLINSAIDERMVIEDATMEEYVEQETEDPQAVKPTIGLEVIEGPIPEEGVCYYRVAANTGGSPSPNITFNRDDSNGAWGSDVAQVNLTSPSDSFTLTATAANSAGSATDSIVLSW